MWAAEVSSSGWRHCRLAETVSRPLTWKSSPYVSRIIQLFWECVKCLEPLVNREESVAIGPRYFGAASERCKRLKARVYQLFTLLRSALESNLVRSVAHFHAGRLAVPCC